MGLGLPPRAGRYRPGGSPFCLRAIRFVDVWMDFISGMGPYPSRCGGTSTSARGQLYPAQVLRTSINQWGWGFTSSVEVSTRGISSPYCWSFVCMEGFLIRAWDTTLRWPRSRHEPQPITDIIRCGQSFYTLRGGVDPELGIAIFCPSWSDL